MQAHPSREAAQEGFARENSLGIKLVDPSRNFRDPNHKPELLVAVTEFHALAGLRPIGDTLTLLDELAVDSLAPYRTILSKQANSDGMRLVLSSLYELSAEELTDAILDLARQSRVYLGSGGSGGRWATVAQTVIELGDRYPKDPGVIAALLLNRLSLKPGEALYLGPGQLHAYLGGIGVEVMGNSDNVLRGGLTSKHVDHRELLQILKFESLANPIVQAVPANVGAPGEFDYPTPERDFAVSRFNLSPDHNSLSFHPEGPEIHLCTSGTIRVTGDHREVTLRPGKALWIPSNTGSVTYSATASATVFRTRVGNMSHTNF